MKLLDKSAIVAEINRVLNSYDLNEITSGRYALVSLRDFIDTLEVKEVDFEKEWKEFLKDGDVGFKEIARHFFELGMQISNKAQKREDNN